MYGSQIGTCFDVLLMLLRRSVDGNAWLERLAICLCDYSDCGKRKTEL